MFDGENREARDSEEEDEVLRRCDLSPESFCDADRLLENSDRRLLVGEREFLVESVVTD